MISRVTTPFPVRKRRSFLIEQKVTQHTFRNHLVERCLLQPMPPLEYRLRHSFLWGGRCDRLIPAPWGCHFFFCANMEYEGEQCSSTQHNEGQRLQTEQDRRVEVVILHECIYLSGISPLTLNRGMSTGPRLSVMEGFTVCWAWKWKSSQATAYTVILATTVKAYLHKETIQQWIICYNLKGMEWRSLCRNIWDLSCSGWHDEMAELVCYFSFHWEFGCYFGFLPVV